VISWFQNFAFKCNLHRYNVRHVTTPTRKTRFNYDFNMRVMVGLCELNAVDPWLESAWSQPLNLKCENPVSKFGFSDATCTALHHGGVCHVSLGDAARVGVRRFVSPVVVDADVEEEDGGGATFHWGEKELYDE
jgi:hypothetical protein